MSKADSELKWAEEVLQVYDLLGSAPVDRGSLSTSVAYMLRHVENDGDIDKFLNGTVPKAVEMLAKHKPANLDDVVVEKDKKNIAELQARLAVCLREAEESASPEPASFKIPDDIPSIDDLF